MKEASNRNGTDNPITFSVAQCMARKLKHLHGECATLGSFCGGLG